MMRCVLKVALLARALGLAAAFCLPEDEDCDTHYDADQDSLIQIRDRRAHAARTLDSAPYPSGCANGYNHEYGVYNDPDCSKGSLPGCRADGVNQNCRYCGTPTSGHGQTYEECPCPTPPSNCTGYNPRYCVYTDATCSERGQPGCLGFNDCRYCGRGEYGPCPVDPEPFTTATTTTTTTSTMTYQACSLGVSVFAPPNPLTGRPGHRLASYSVPAWKCTQVDPDDDTVFFTSSWRSPDEFPMCYFQTLGTVKWYNTSDCSGTAFASQLLFTDGDTMRYGCKDSRGNTLDPAWCRGRWR